MNPIQQFLGPLMYVPLKWRYGALIVAIARAVGAFELSIHVPSLYRALGTGTGSLSLTIFPEFVVLEDWLNTDPSILPHLALAAVIFVDTVVLALLIYRRIMRRRLAKHPRNPWGGRNMRW